MTERVSGLTVKRTSRVTPIGAVEPLVAVLPVLPVRVPPLPFGEPFGKSCVVAMLKVEGPLAKPRTRRIYFVFGWTADETNSVAVAPAERVIT